jgi:DNA replication protein DnaC
MLNQQTYDRLTELKLYSLLTHYRQQSESPEMLNLSFEERFALLVDAEWIARKNGQLQRLLKEAKMSMQACIEDVNYDPRRKLDRHLMARLSTLEWIGHHQSILITGKTGCGKTFIASAFGNLACRHGIATKYYRVAKLLEEFQVAKGEGTFFRLFNALRKASLLILDDWGLKPLNQQECGLLFELVEERHEKGATIISSQIPVEHWHKILTDPTLCDAILDRIIPRDAQRDKLKQRRKKKTTIDARHRAI